MQIILRRVKKYDIGQRSALAWMQLADVARAPSHLQAAQAAALSVMVLSAMPARAGISDTVQPYVLSSINHDDNLLRQSDDAPGDRGDTYKSVEAGLQFARPIGRQLFSGSAKVTKVAFDNYEQLNYNGKEVQGVWAWQLGNHLQGNLGGSYAQTLAPYADFHTSERNLRLQRREYADGTWRFHPSWQVHGGWSRNRYEFELASQKFNNRTEDAAEIGADYLAGSGSRIGVVLRQLKGTYTGRAGVTSFFLDNGYMQDELKADIVWIISGVSKLTFLGGAVKRKHAVFAVRDASALNARLVYDWIPTGKLHFTGKLYREFTAVEGSVLNDSLNRGGSVDVAYALSAKVSMTASAGTERRGFRTIPGIVTDKDLTDSSRLISAGVIYAPLPAVQLGINAFHDARSGNLLVGSNSYKANGVSFNISAQF